MENRVNGDLYRTALFVMILAAIGGLAFAAGIAWSLRPAHAAERGGKDAAPKGSEEKKIKVVYPKRTEVEFDGMDLQGETQGPGEFYFQLKPEEKFDSLVKRRKNFHREMLRDVVLSK